LKHGGTGGYIFIKAYQKFNKSSIDSGVRIISNGGHGKNGGYGGSGGIMIFDNITISAESVNATPGYTLTKNNSIDTDNILACKNGGPGTIYYP
jgi:hypothetical protein